MKINNNGVLTIPARFRKAGFVPDSYVNVHLEEDGTLRVVPIEAIPKNQLGFHSREWLTKEKAASEDLRKGKVKTYRDEEQFVKTMAKW